jgi:Cys-tRNA(Pro)/Cys-tRNA(Cys) deacylase
MTDRGTDRQKTNAMRVLDRSKVLYQAFSYNPEIRSADGVAQALGLPHDMVFKTLVMVSEERRPLLLMAPGDREVDMRRVAREIGTKSVRMAPKRDAERLTGLETGGIGALALIGKPFDVYLDRYALNFEAILVNGGKRGLNLRVPTADLIRLTVARIIDVSTKEQGTSN